jgi:CubicO group peptidase (beta-lactamase class C family)
VTAERDAVTSTIAELCAHHAIPAVGVAVCDASGPVWSTFSGTASRGGAAAVGPRTVWSLQSQSKMYTATAVLLAVQDGVLDLDKPVRTYLPDFFVHSVFEPDAAARITLRHLLSHTAGFTHEAPIGSNFRLGPASFASHCTSIRDTWLRFPVGHHFAYSNLGVDLAAQILVTVTGRTFATHLRDRLLKPLGTERATFDHRAIARDDDRAEGHNSGRRRLPTRVPMVASGGLWASVEDATRYASLHLSHGGGLVDPGLLDEQYTVPGDHPVETGYGLGIITRRKNGMLVRGHSGGGFGFLSDTYWAPEHGIGVAVVTNTDDNPVQGQLVFDLLAQLVGVTTLPATSAPAPRRVAAEPSLIAGEYVSREDRVGLVLVNDTWTLEEGEHRHTLATLEDGAAIDEVGEVYRHLPCVDSADYLQRISDGHTWAHNELPDLTNADSTRQFVVRELGARYGDATLTDAGDGSAVFAFADEPPVRLDERRPGQWFSAHGELLDLTHVPATYANIELREPSEQKRPSLGSADNTRQAGT